MKSPGLRDLSVTNKQTKASSGHDSALYNEFKVKLKKLSILDVEFFI
jgi:hypothetical protein